MRAGNISTICIGGFPPDATPRELKNLCRFIYGFEGAHVAFAGLGQPGRAAPTSLFVKFQSSDLAQSAMDAVAGQPFDLDQPDYALRAEWARREMEVRQSSLPQPRQAPPPAYGRAPAPLAQPAFAGGPRARLGTTGDELVTIAILGMREKGTDPESLRSWFQERPGFVALQINERIDAVFVKFGTSAAASQAIEDANAQNLGAEWARRNLDDDRSSAAGAPPPAAYPVGGHHNSGYRGGQNHEELVTIAIMGLKDKGLTQEHLLDWAQQRFGFLKLQVNDRIGGCFVKFATGADAEAALQDANAAGYGADWARRNLDDDLGSKNAAVPHAGVAAPPWAGPQKRPRVQHGELDTITVLHLTEKEAAHGGGVQQWFQERPGFMALQINERIDALFVKFSSAAAASQAIEDAGAVAIGAEWARRNLDL